MPTSNDSLLTDFPPVDDAAWTERIRQDLKGRDPDAVLRWDSPHGVSLPAYARRGTPSFGPLAVHPGWRAVEDLSDTEPSAWNAASEAAASAGAEGVLVHVVDADGLEAANTITPSRWIDVGAAIPTPDVVPLLRPQDVAVIDPFAAAFAGEAPLPDARIAAFFEALPSGVPGRPWAIDLRPYAAASATLQLACAFGAAAEWLDRAGPSAARGLHVCVPIGTSFFPTVAHLRALRVGLSAVLRAFGRNDESVPVTGFVDRRTLASYGVHNNLLRITTSLVAGVIGGCDALSAPPFNAPLQPDARGRRLVRNVHHLLRDEGHLHRVADPAAGAWYVEEATRRLGAEAWRVFRAWEAQGGFAAAIARGAVRQAVDEGRERARHAVDARERTVVGVNDFPDPTDAPAALRTVADSPLAGMEALRWAVGRASVGPPAALVLRLGPGAKASVRVDFVRNFLGCGGFVTLAIDATDAASAALAMERHSPALVVACGEDASYKSYLAALQTRLGANRPLLLAAGRPPNDEPAAWSADAVIHAGSPPLETLTRLARVVGRTP